jgi:hypothetical protein
MSKPQMTTANARPGLLARVGAKLGFGHRDLEYQAPLTPSETRALLDSRARESLGLSAEEFERQLKDGTLRGTSVVHGLAMLVGEDSARVR